MKIPDSLSAMKIFRRAWGMVVALTVAFTAGCGTTESGRAEDRAQASVKIEFASRFNVEKALGGVFAAEGYVLVGRTADELTFEKPGGAARIVVLITNPEFRIHHVHGDAYGLPGGVDGGAGAGWVPRDDRKPELRRMLREVKKVAKLL